MHRDVIYDAISHVLVAHKFCDVWSAIGSMLFANVPIIERLA